MRACCLVGWSGATTFSSQTSDDSSVAMPETWLLVKPVLAKPLLAPSVCGGSAAPLSSRKSRC